ncbi:MAG: fumarylacetoacetate hydrolase family protein, partial [Hyphomicrobiaceae bacterium]
VSFSVDGEQVASGTGALVMGHPLNALAWTVSKLGAIGLALEAGQIVTTGTCTGVNFVKAGQHAVANFGGLGKVEAQFV